jgi:uncharacterized membrane protein
MSLPPLHPIVVHFPVALIISAFALDLLGMIFKSRRIRAAAFPVLALAVLGTVAAAGAGYLAESQLKVKPDEMIKLIEIHETLALVTLGAVIVALIFKALAEYRKNLEGILGQIAFIAMLAATIMVGATGYFGGEMVFKHGAGSVFYEKVNKSSQTQTPGDEHNVGGAPTYHGEEQPRDWH